jgi:hypothetical protein
MIGWVSSGMLLEETRMCGADAKLGVSFNMLLVSLCVTSCLICVNWQGPFGAREMISWGSSGMRLEETRTC